jgi:hypothetical protein
MFLLSFVGKLDPDLQRQFTDLVPSNGSMPPLQQFPPNTKADIDTYLDQGKLKLTNQFPGVVNSVGTTSYYLAAKGPNEESAYDELGRRTDGSWVLIDVADAASYPAAPQYRIVQTTEPTNVIALAGQGEDWAIYDPLTPLGGGSSSASVGGGVIVGLVAAAVLGGLLLAGGR